jgi:hypothetical protein
MTRRDQEGARLNNRFSPTSISRVLPLAHQKLVKKRVAADLPKSRCESRARLEEVQEGAPGGTGIVSRMIVQCVLSKGHDGPHSSRGRKLPFSSKWKLSEWD